MKTFTGQWHLQVLRTIQIIVILVNAQNKVQYLPDTHNGYEDQWKIGSRSVLDGSGRMTKETTKLLN
jgi:hypothetical protein